MGRLLPITSAAERVIASNICGGIEHAATLRAFGCDLVRCASCGLVFVAHPQAYDDDRTEAGDLHALREPAARAIAKRWLGMGDGRYLAARRHD